MRSKRKLLILLMQWHFIFTKKVMHIYSTPYRIPFIIWFMLSSSFPSLLSSLSSYMNYLVINNNIRSRKKMWNVEDMLFWLNFFQGFSRYFTFYVMKSGSHGMGCNTFGSKNHENFFVLFKNFYYTFTQYI